MSGAQPIGLPSETAETINWNMCDKGNDMATTALCLFTLHFQPWLFLRRLDELLTREISLVTSVSSLREKSHG